MLQILNLKTIKKYLGPLSTSDPVAMRELLPNLINSIRMIHTISRYYNTSERMTSLFVKVTNQMIKSCRNYIMQGSSGKIWDQNEDDVLARIDACIALNDEYQGKNWFYRRSSIGLILIFNLRTISTCSWAPTRRIRKTPRKRKAPLWLFGELHFR